MKTRRHHNNDGLRQIKRGKTRRWVAALAKRMGVPYGKRTRAQEAPTGKASPAMGAEGEAAPRACSGPHGVEVQEATGSAKG